MSPLEMKEIRIPSALIRERRPSVLWILGKTTFIALLLAVMCFFVINALAIAGVAIARGISHRPFDFAIAYRDFAAPVAAGLFVLLWIAALIFFWRDRKNPA
ncbi:MAG TPA: hypothetical protein VFQ00_05385 [Terriglobales bacterium]|nr:hypothetical protein [Terriglobales bacterium]